MSKEHFLEGQDPHRTAIVPAVESMLEIKVDLSGRSGFNLDALDDETHEEILQTLVRIIEPKCREFARQKALEALGLFWAQKFPSEVLPSEELIAAVDTVLPKA